MSVSQTQTVEDRLEQNGIVLPQTAAPLANYVPYLLIGNHLFISGQLPMKDGSIAITGKVGDTLSLEQGVEAAKLCAINILAQAKAALGSLDRISTLAKLGGFVAAPPSFTDHPKVINGASDLMVSVLGDAGRHTRFAVGASALPLDAAVEIDALFIIDN